MSKLFRVPFSVPFRVSSSLASPDALGRGGLAAAAIVSLLLAAFPVAAGPTGILEGRVRGPEGLPVVGAMVSFQHGDPLHELTIFTNELGDFVSPPLAAGDAYTVRVRRLGWRDLFLRDQPVEAGAVRALGLELRRETNAAALAAQLPSNRWYALLLARFEQEGQREEFVRQCTYCHQQGSAATRRHREPEEWHKVLSLMARMGGGLSPELRALVPELFESAYDPKTAIPALTAGMDSPNFAPAPPRAVREAIIEEWQLGHRASMQHDLVVHPDGRIYSVDMTQDKLYRLDPSAPGAGRIAFDVPRGDLPPGGVFGGANTPTPPNANAHVGPHSLQVAPDGAIWTTLALGNQLARFDPETESWETYPLDEGFYPHTLRFDARGRIWYTLAVSNHIGMLDPSTDEHRSFRLPARSWSQAVALRMLPALLWLNRNFDLGSAADSAGEGAVSMPVPYGIDVAPDGGIWFSQLNEHRIGRIDPDSFEIELIDTPFTAPRRLRFDSKGDLWIPGFSSGLISRFSPATRSFESYALPIEPLGSETPYALNVDRRSDTVWICGTNSDTLIRFDPRRRAAGDGDGFTVFPLPTHVTYTREIDFDERGRVWTSNSNMPTWQIEGGFPRVLRLDAAPGTGSAAQEIALQ